MDTSKFGITTPALTRTEGGWEETGTFDDVARIVAAADRLGYDHVTCSEHIGVPAEEAPRRGVRYYDPLATFGYFSAITRRIRFATSALVLGYHHPLEIAKRYGTLDVVSGGRLILGLGVGSLKQEFDLLGLGGVEFEQRGARGDDALRALRAALGKRDPEYHGPVYDFAGLTLDPCAVQQHVPLWIGGRSARSLRRAVELGDAWMPFGLTVEELAALIARAKETPGWRQRETPPELVLSVPARPLDPAAQPGDAVSAVRRVFDAGATRVVLNFRSESPSHYIEQLEAFAALSM